MLTRFSSARRGVAAVLATVLTLQPALAATLQYRIPLETTSQLTPAPVKPPKPGTKPGSGDGEIDTGADPEAARAPELTVTPAALQFESNPDVSPVSRSSLIANTGPVSTTVSGLDSNEYFSVSHDCPDVLPVDAVCSVTVTPTSAAPGVLRYRMGVIAPGAETQASIDITTYERNAATPAPRLSLTNDLVFLGDLDPGQPAQGSTTLTNRGNASALLGGVISNKNFAVTHDCPAELTPGASCAISAAFQAYDAKSYQHTMTLLSGTSDDSVPLTFYASIKGNPALLPALALDTSVLSFGPLEPGTSATKKVVLSNRGTMPAQLEAITGDKNFVVASGCPELLAPNASCDISVTFNALTAGATPSYELAVHAQDNVSVKMLLSGQVAGGAAKDGAPAPKLSFEPEQYAFGAVAVGQSVSGTAKLTNIGLKTATLSSILVDAGDPTYRMTHTCGASLAPAASCQVTLTFHPTTAWTHAGRVKATASTGDSALLSLSGTGQQAQLSVGPSSVDFGVTVELAPTVSRTISLSNSGNVPLTGLAVINSDSRLSLDYGTCTAVLEPQKGCSMSLRYSPGALGTFAGSFQVVSANGGAAVVAWSGAAVSLQASASSLSFPSARVGTSAPDQSIELTNSGPSTVPIDGIGMLSGQYHFGQSNNCGKGLAPGASCTVAVRFTPALAGAQQGAVGVTVNGSVLARVDLSGTGTLPQLVLSPTSLRFADTNVGQTSPVLSLTVSNPTNEVATFTGLGISSGETEFAQSNNCGASLLAGQSCTVSVQMTPASVAGSSGSLSVVSSFGSMTVSLSGKGTEPQGGVEGVTMSTPASTVDQGSEYDGFTQYAINFLDTEVGRSSAVRNVKFTNRGDGPLTVLGLSIVKGDTDYAQSNNCGAVLAPGAFCTISLLFSPSALKERLGAVALTSDGGNFLFNLKGVGIGAEGSWRADSSADYGVVAVNTKASRTFTLTNVGTVAAAAIETVVNGDNVRLTANTCGAPGAPVGLGVGASCRATVEYAPIASGDMTATLQTTGTLANGPVTLALKGSSPPPALAFDAAPDGKFGTITVGTNTSRTYYLRNTGKLTDTLASLTTEGSGFAVTGGTCQPGLNVGAGNVCTVTVTANPPVKGPYAGALRVSSTQGAIATLALSAEAIQSEYVVSGSSTSTTAPATDYGTLTAGSGTVNRTFFLRDNEKIAVVSAQNVTLASDGNFKILNVMRVDDTGRYISSCTTTATATTAPCATTAPGHTIGVEVQFAPQTVGAKSAVLRFEHNGASRVSELTLNGAGEFNPTAVWSMAGSSVVAPTEANLAYGTLTPGTSAEKSFYLRNVGTHGAQAVGFKLSGDTGQFKVTQVLKSYQGTNGYHSSCNSSTGQVASGGASTTPCRTDDLAGQGFNYAGIYVTIRYTPSSVGDYSVTVTPTTDNGTALPAPIVLQGSAQFNPTAVWSSSGASLVAPTDAYLAMGTLTTGTSADKGVYVRNIGTHGGQAVGFKLSGDTSQFKVTQVVKSYQGTDGYHSACNSSTGQIASGGASTTPCLADDVAGSGFKYGGVYVVVRYTPTSVGDHRVTVTPITNNGTVLPDPITITGSGQFNPTAAWSVDGSRLVTPTDAQLAFGTRTNGSVTDKGVYLRNVGTHGNMAVGFKLTGDTSQFKVVQVVKSYQGTNGYHTTCTSSTGQIASGGASTTSCLADDIAGSGFKYGGIYVSIRYNPTSVGSHSVTITPTTSNGTVLPEPITLTGTSEFNAEGVWSASATSTVVPTAAYLGFGSRAVGTTLDKLVYVRNIGTHGGQSVGFTLTGDTSHFKIVRVSRTSQYYNNYPEACSPAVKIDTSGTSTTPCLATDVTSGGMQTYGVEFTLRYAPTAPGNHTVTVTPMTNNGTRLPEPLTFNGAAP